MQVKVPHCRIGHLYHMDYNGLGNHYFVYIGRDEANKVYHFRMITSCDTDRKKRKLQMYQQANPARYLTLTEDSADHITHASYIDVEFTVPLTDEQVRKRLMVNNKHLNDKGALREEDFNRLLKKCHLLNTPPAVARNSGVYRSVHAL